MWNIEDLTSDKIVDDHFLSVISKFHIISFVETWTSEYSQCPSLSGFEFISSGIRKKHKKARRNSGGICIYAKSALVKGIKQLHNV